jgi:hypothetical protein
MIDSSLVALYAQALDLLEFAQKRLVADLQISSRSVCLDAAFAAAFNEESLSELPPCGGLTRATRKSAMAKVVSPKATIFFATFSNSRMFPGQ